MDYALLWDLFDVFLFLQMGTHTTLMKRKGNYFNLVQQQERQEKEENNLLSTSRAQG